MSFSVPTSRSLFPQVAPSRCVVEHRDILEGFDAQIARLDHEDELFRRIIGARNRDEAQVVFDALAKVARGLS